MSRLLTQPLLFYQDANGVPLPGARCEVYLSGTSTPAVVYKDGALTIPHSNPVIAATNGYFPAMYSQAGVDLKLILTDQDGGNPLPPIDPATAYVLTQAEIGAVLYPQTEAEDQAAITPANTVYAPYDPRRYGAAGDGNTDDAEAIQQADTAAKQAGVPVILTDGVYMVDITTRGSPLLQTTSWIAQPGAQVIIRRKDFTATTAFFTMQQTSKSGLTLSGITFDGQLTTAGSLSPNQEPAPTGTYNDTTDESLWRKVYGVRLFNASRAIVENCTFTNFLRAGLWIDGDGLTHTTPAISSDVKVSNCTVRRTRSGSAGDGFYVGGATDVKFSNCHAYDFQRIGFVTEFAQTDNVTNCRDIEYVNCTADFGHDVVAPESNVGFWTEDGDNIKYTNCTAKNVGAGYVCNAGRNADTGSTRPWTASIGYVNCSSIRSKIAMRTAFGGTRSVHLTVTDFFGEADRLAPTYAGETLGLRAGILVQVNEITSGVNFRLDFRDIKIHALNQSIGTATNGFGCIRFAQGTVTTPQQLIVNVDGLQTQWTLTNGTDDVAAKTDFQSVTDGYFGDVIFSGANDTTPDGRFKGHAMLSRLHNHTFGYAMVSSEFQSTASNLTISKSRVCMRKASQTNNGTLTISDCPLVDFRGDVGWTKIMMANSTLADANSLSKDRTSLSCPLTILTGNHILRQLWINANGGDTSHRKLRLVASGNSWDIPFDTEPGLRFTIADSTFAHAAMSGNAFRNLGTGSIGSTDVMILVSTATGTMQFSGAGNVFDDTVITGGGHMLQTNSTPTYQDAPQTATGNLMSVWGVRAVFDPV